MAGDSDTPVVLRLLAEDDLAGVTAPPFALRAIPTYKKSDRPKSTDEERERCDSMISGRQGGRSSPFRAEIPVAGISSRVTQ